MAKKIIFVFLIVISSFFLINREDVFAGTGEIHYQLAGEKEENCESLFGNPKKDGTFANFLQQIFTIMGYAAPILCLALSTFDFVKAAASQDKDALNKAIKSTIKRLILAVILFFLPTLINFLFPLFGWYGTCGIE